MKKQSSSSSARMFSAFVDELIKIAIAPPNPLKVLKSGPFSTNVGARSSINMAMPRQAPIPPAGRITTAFGSSIAKDVPGVNLRAPRTGQVGGPASAGIAPASPTHVAPQVSPVNAPVPQGAPQTVSTSAPTAGAAQASQGAGQARAR